MSEVKPPKRDFLLNRDITASTVQDSILGIYEINQYDDEQNEVGYERKPIRIIVDSNGGNCYDAMALVNSMDTSTTPVHTYCYGKSFSMGLTIFAAGHKRFAHPLATFMHHQISGGTNSKLITMVEDIKQNVKLQEMLDDFLISKTNIKKSKVLRLRETKTDWFFTGKEAIELGVADELIVRKVK